MNTRYWVNIGSLAIALSLGSAATAIAQTQESAPTAPITAPQSATQLFVNPVLGQDTADGSQRSPLRTLTHALELAHPNTVIILAPGTYSADTGEQFPIQLTPGVTVQGNPDTLGSDVVIRGGGDILSRSAARQTVTLVGNANATLTGVTVTNPNPRGYGLWIESGNPTVVSNTFTGSSHDGISVTGTATPTIRSNLFQQNGASGLSIFGSARPQIVSNRFQQTGYGINLGDSAAPRIEGNHLTGNRIAVVVQENARPLLRRNIIEASTEEGIVVLANALADLGTTLEPGNNQFRSNVRADLHGAGQETSPAFGNQLVAERIQGRVDLTGMIVMTALPQGGESSRVAPVASVSPSVTPVQNASPVAIAVQAAPNVTRRPSSIAPTEISVPLPDSSLNAVEPASAPEASPVREIVSRRAGLQSGLPPAPVSATPAPDTLVASRPEVGVAPRSLEIASLADVLPVPSATIPLGNTGDMPRVTVWQDPTRRSGGPTSGTSQGTATLRYRVLVDASSEQAQAVVRSLIPEAFRTWVNGRVMMQTGAYSDRANADETAQRLNSSGLRAFVESIR